jgi:hypothetical protein
MKWLSLHIGGQLWSVHLVSGKSPRLRTEDRVLHGRTFFDRCRIYVSKDLDEQAREDTLLHELLHASLFVSGADAALINTYGKDADAAEEHVVTHITPVLHRLLKDLGFAFPKGP